jgi:hypothetical protein
LNTNIIVVSNLAQGQQDTPSSTQQRQTHTGHSDRSSRGPSSWSRASSYWTSPWSRSNCINKGCASYFISSGGDI